MQSRLQQGLNSLSFPPPFDLFISYFTSSDNFLLPFPEQTTLTEALGHLGSFSQALAPLWPPLTVAPWTARALRCSSEGAVLGAPCLCPVDPHALWVEPGKSVWAVLGSPQGDVAQFVTVKRDFSPGAKVDFHRWVPQGH